MLDIQEYSDKDGSLDIPLLLKALADLVTAKKVYFREFSQEKCSIGCDLIIELVARDWIITNESALKED